MKKINSNGYGGRLLGVAVTFTLLLPCVFLFSASQCLYDSKYIAELLFLFAKSSFCTGILIVIFLVILLLIEFYQDDQMLLHYEAQKNHKLDLMNGLFECQTCGNRTVRPNEKSCSICGAIFNYETKHKNSKKGMTQKMKSTDHLPELSKTLLIPLAVRAKESESPNPLFTDTVAAAVFKQVSLENVIYDGGNITTHGILARTQVIDTEIKEILNVYPKSIILNLGAGLDTRLFRLDNGQIQWYDLDLPEVITLRKELIPEHERLHLITGSVLTPSWISEVMIAENDTVIIIAEGLLMYFQEEEVKTIFRLLISSFPNSHVFFDAVHSYFTGKGISSNFHWGIKKTADIEKLNGNIIMLKAFCAGDLCKNRQSLIFRLLNIFPSTRNRSRIIHLKLRAKDQPHAQIQ